MNHDRELFEELAVEADLLEARGITGPELCRHLFEGYKAANDRVRRKKEDLFRRGDLHTEPGAGAGSSLEAQKETWEVSDTPGSAEALQSLPRDLHYDPEPTEDDFWTGLR